MFEVMSQIYSSLNSGEGAALEQNGSTTSVLPSSPNDTVEQEIISFGGLDVRQIARVRALQDRRGSSFAEAAIALGIIGREHLLQALSKHYNYPVLTPSNGAARFSRELVVGFDAFGAQAEALRSTCAALISSAIKAKTNSIAFIGPRPGVGVSYLCANIALSLAQAGVRTLLVDANLRRPRVGKMFGIDRQRGGLADAINYRLTETPPIAVDVVPNLSVLAAGLTPPNPQELLASPEFAAICMDVRRRFGVVIYDTTNTEECVDGLIVASRVGAVALVGRRHKIIQLNRHVPNLCPAEPGGEVS